MTDNLRTSKDFQTKLVNARNKEVDSETCFQEPDKNKELKKLFI